MGYGKGYAMGYAIGYAVGYALGTERDVTEGVEVDTVGERERVHTSPVHV